MFVFGDGLLRGKQWPIHCNNCLMPKDHQQQPMIRSECGVCFRFGLCRIFRWIDIVVDFVPPLREFTVDMGSLQCTSMADWLNPFTMRGIDLNCSIEEQMVEVLNDESWRSRSRRSGLRYLPTGKAIRSLAVQFGKMGTVRSRRSRASDAIMPGNHEACPKCNHL